MRNNNQKIINHLSRKSLKNNRLRNIFAITAIVLTTVLFTTLFTLSIGMVQSMQEETMRQSGGSAHGSFKRLTYEQYNKLKDHPLIKEIGYSIVVGYPKNDELMKRITEMRFATDNQAKWYFSYPTEGSMPQKVNEIAMDTIVLDMLGVPHEIGASITLSYSVNDELFTKDFILSGYWEGDIALPASQIWVSQAFIDENLAHLDQHHQQQLHHNSGLIFADIMFHNSFNIEEKLETIITESGYELKDITYGVNWAYMSTNFATVDMMTAVVMIGATLLIIFTGYLIIYNIFQISITNDIRFYGLLKTIGTTSKQIKKLVRKQAYLLSIIGIPIGLLLGYMLGVILLPVIVRITNIHVVNISANPIIFIGAALFSLLTIFISTKKPSKLAAKVSPIEAVRYTGIHLQSKRKTKKSANGAKIYRMALSNLARNKQKTVVVITSMSLSLILLHAAYTITAGFDMDKYLSKQIPSDFVAGHADYFRNDFRNEEDTPSQHFIDAINDMEGIIQAGKTYFSFNSHHLNSTAMQNLNDIYPDEYVEQLDSIYKHSITEAKKTGNIPLHIYGLNDFLLEKLDIEQGTFDKEKFHTGNYIFMSMPRFAKEGNNRSYYNIGDKITITYDDKTEKTYEVMGMASMPHNLSVRRYSAEGFVCFLPETEFLSQVKNPMFINYAFDVDDKHRKAMEQFLEHYTNHIEPMMNYKSKQTYIDEFKQVQNTFFIIGSVLSFIVGLIGILNFINAMLTSIITRKREFAMLRSIGMTKQQLYQMITFEGLYHAILTMIITLTLGNIISYLICHALAEQIWFFSYHFTLLPILIAAPIFILLTILIPVLAFKHTNQQTLVEQLRETE